MSHCVYETCTVCGEEECVRGSNCSPCRCTRERRAEEERLAKLKAEEDRKVREATDAFKAGYVQALTDAKVRS